MVGMKELPVSSLFRLRFKPAVSFGMESTIMEATIASLGSPVGESTVGEEPSRGTHIGPPRRRTLVFVLCDDELPRVLAVSILQYAAVGGNDSNPTSGKCHIMATPFQVVFAVFEFGQRFQ